jgi:hypothetical protein
MWINIETPFLICFLTKKINSVPLITFPILLLFLQEI